MKNCTPSLHLLKAQVQMYLSRIVLLLAIVILVSVTSIFLQGARQTHLHRQQAFGVHALDDHDPWD
jgi:accessory gene regulator protein AgrB